LNSLLAELSSDEISFARLARLIEKDSILTAAFLQRANSAIFQRGSPVRSVLQALTRLGTAELRRFALSLSANWSLARMKLPAHFSRTRYSRHASATALMTSLIEQELGNAHGNHAHLAALLHDVSRLLVAAGLPEEFSRIVERGHWDEEREMECLGMGHGELSAVVLEVWKMPSEVCEAVHQHHAEVAGGLHPSLAAVLSAADRYTTTFVDNNEPEIDMLDGGALRGLGLGMDAAIPRLTAEFQAQATLAPQWSIHN
jgi:putative nucleotidyltransferase with HDIG domain